VGWSPIMTAASSGKLEILRLLWPHGAPNQANAKTSNGSTPLVYAASKGHLPVVEFLIEQKANVNAEDKHHNTALLRGARYPDVVKSLLAHKASVDHVNDVGDSALHLAAEENNEQSCRALLAAGADPVLKNSDGKSSIEMGGKPLEHVWITKK